MRTLPVAMLVFLAVGGACRSSVATMAVTLGAGTAAGGNALLLTSPDDEDEASSRRVYGIILLGVASYLFLAAAVAERHAREVPEPSHGTGSAIVTDDTLGAAPGDADDTDEPEQPVRGGGYYYDRTGAHAGRFDSAGNFYDHTGASAGRVDNDGYFYDRTGAQAGRIDRGNVYDGTGAPAGRIDDQGTIYDRTGAPTGRIDAQGNIYDRTGAHAGRVDGTCDAACRETTAAKILLDR